MPTISSYISIDHVMVLDIDVVTHDPIPELIVFANGEDPDSGAYLSLEDILVGKIEMTDEEYDTYIEFLKGVVKRLEHNKSDRFDGEDNV